MKKPYGPGPGMVCIRPNPDHTFTVTCDLWSPTLTKGAEVSKETLRRLVHLLVLNAVIE